MKIRIRGDDGIALRGAMALPIGNGRSRSADDGDESHDILKVHDGIEHDLRLAYRYEIIAKAISPGARHARLSG